MPEPTPATWSRDAKRLRTLGTIVLGLAVIGAALQFAIVFGVVGGGSGLGVLEAVVYLAYPLILVFAGLVIRAVMHGLAALIEAAVARDADGR